MNERIKQLYEQAHERKPTMRTSPVTWQPVPALGHDGVPMYSNEFNPDMFAELLIKDCIEAIQNESMNSDDDWERGLRIAEGAIQTHFGVEE